jgi:Leucine-rich repeat (LRR) protein
LSSIDAGTFNGLNLLTSKSLSLSNNKIKTMNPKAFKDTKNLTSLEISNNLIKYIEQQTFFSLSQLRILDFKSNKLHYINSCAFYNLKKLENWKHFLIV